MPMVTARWCGRNQLVSTASVHGCGWVPVGYCPAQRANMSEELEINAVLTYKVFHAELSPIRRGVSMEREERSQLRLRPCRQNW
jgi:hypothetical protein